MAALATHVRHAVGKALRETGSAMERAGMALGGDQSFWDHTSRHTTTVSFADRQPCVAPDSCVAPSATIYGAASVGAKATVGAGAVVFGPSVIGDGAVVGANSVVHADVLGSCADGAVVVSPPGGRALGGPAGGRPRCCGKTTRLISQIGRRRGGAIPSERGRVAERDAVRVQ